MDLGITGLDQWICKASSGELREGWVCRWDLALAGETEAWDVGAGSC